jgi:hypothetical protein
VPPNLQEKAMISCKVLLPFTQHVPDYGMVVGNAGAVVQLPFQYAQSRRARGYVDYDDEDAKEEMELDAARPKSLLERRALARAQRMKEHSDRAAAIGDAEVQRSASPPKRPSFEKKTSAATKTASPLKALRDQYKALVGKLPSPRLDAAGIEAKLTEFTSDPAALAKAQGSAGSKRAAPKKTARVSSDAPVD